MEEHLAKNGVKLDKTDLTVGRPLKFDGEKEQFVNDPEANKLLTRDYREPFAIDTSV